MRKTFYTLWWKDPHEEDARLITEASGIRHRMYAFKYARYLCSRPEYRGCTILVRKIKLGSNACIEWRFPYKED